MKWATKAYQNCCDCPELNVASSTLTVKVVHLSLNLICCWDKKELLISSRVFVTIDWIVVDLMIKFINGSLALVEIPCDFHDNYWWEILICETNFRHVFCSRQMFIPHAVLQKPVVCSQVGDIKFSSLTQLCLYCYGLLLDWQKLGCWDARYCSFDHTKLSFVLGFPVTGIPKGTHCR